MKAVFIIFIMMLFWGCSQKKEHKQNTFTEAVTDSVKDNTDLVYGIQIHEMTDDCILITSNGLLTYSLLANDPTLDKLQMVYENIFNVRKEETTRLGEIDYIYTLTYKDSFVKIFLNRITGTNDIVSARILNSDIKMLNGLYVGMSKSSFFKEILGGYVDVKRCIADIFINSDEIGQIEQTFVFDNDVLKEVIIRSDYDWINFDL